jgi:hypothetical protein
MAITSLTVNPQKITVDGTDEHQLDWQDMLNTTDFQGSALIKLISGTSVQFNVGGSVTADSAALQTADDKFILTLNRNKGNIYYKGGAGSEVFSVTIVA